jgi:hypothetical protein
MSTPAGTHSNASFAAEVQSIRPPCAGRAMSCGAARRRCLIRPRRRSRWHAHFTPTSSSWVNQVERFFALLSEQQIKRGAHRSVADLEAAITAYIKIRNAAPKPFRWTKSAGDILASIERFCRRTLDTHAKCA